MFANFREAFKPEPDEIKRWETFVQSVELSNREFLIESGLTETEIGLLYELEAQETARLHKYESYVSRVDLLRNGITTVDEIRSELTC